MIIINVSKLSGTEVLKLPRTNKIYGLQFQLAGCLVQFSRSFHSNFELARKKVLL